VSAILASLEKTGNADATKANDRIQCRICEERYYYERTEQVVRGGRVVGRLERPASADVETEAEADVDGGEGDTGAEMDVDAGADAVPTTATTTDPNQTLRLSGLSDGFSPLVNFDSLPRDVTNLRVEELLRLWETLHLAQPLLGDVMLGFEDLLRALVPPPSDLPTVSQVVFDEVCTTLGSVLMRCVTGYMGTGMMVPMDAVIIHMQERLPLNVLTWQYCCRRLIRAVSEAQAARNAACLRDTSKKPVGDKTSRVRTVKPLSDAINGNYVASLILDAAYDGPVADAMTLLVTHPQAHVLWRVKADLLEALVRRRDSLAQDAADGGAGVDAKATKAATAAVAAEIKHIEAHGADLSTLMAAHQSGVLSSMSMFVERCDAMWVFCSYTIAGKGSGRPPLSQTQRQSALEVELWLEGYLKRVVTQYHPELAGAVAMPAREVTEVARRASLSAATSHPGSWGRHVTADARVIVTVPEDPFNANGPTCAVTAGGQSWDASTISPSSFGYRPVLGYETLGGSTEHARLERVLEVLRVTEPERMSFWRRFDVIHVMQGIIIRSEEFAVSHMRKYSPRHPTTNVDMIEFDGNNDPVTDVPKKPSDDWDQFPGEFMDRTPLEPYPAGYVGRCALSSMPAAMVNIVDTPMRWYKLHPQFTLNAVSLPRGTSFYKPRTGVAKDPNGPISLHNVYERVVAAYEVAQQRFNARLVKQGDAMDAMKSNALEKNYRGGLLNALRTEPLGYDRRGHEYWLLEAQHHNPLGQVGGKQSKGRPLYDPCILVRTTTGAWARHNGMAVEELVDSLSDGIPIESHLRQSIAFEWLRARNRAQKTTLKVRAPHPTSLLTLLS